MPEVVTFSDRIINPATLFGVAVTALTLEIYNQKLILQNTLIYPSGISQIINPGPDYEYKVVSYDVSDQNKYPGEFIFVKWIPTVSAGIVPSWIQTVGIRTIAAPVIPPERNPYIDVVEAEDFFQTRLDYTDWQRFITTDPVMVLRALVTASDQIDKEKFKGQKVRLFDNSYMRQFPRLLPYSEAVASFFNNFDTIPKQVRYACAVQALYLMKQRERAHDIDARMDLQLKGLTSVQRGEHTENYDLNAASNHLLCRECFQYLHPFLAQGIDNIPTYY